MDERWHRWWRWAQDLAYSQVCSKSEGFTYGSMAQECSDPRSSEWDSMGRMNILVVSREQRTFYFILSLGCQRFSPSLVWGWHVIPPKLPMEVQKIEMQPHSWGASMKSRRKNGIYAYLSWSTSVLAELRMTRWFAQLNRYKIMLSKAESIEILWA
jgi:hypothetical protein